MNPKNLLKIPALYDLKTRLLSFGRPNVWRFLESIPKLPPDARVLDMGCGTGRHAEIFGACTTGVDIVRQYLTHARATHPGRFAVMDAVALGFPDETFDFVYAVGLFHHLDDSQAYRAAQEMRRVLRPVGSALIIDAVLPRWTNPIGLALARLDRGAYVRSFENLYAILETVGFVVRLRNLPHSYPYERAIFTVDG